jgi:hypothetical protein
LPPSPRAKPTARTGPSPQGVALLAAYDLRRLTADIDFAALQTPNDVATISRLVTDVARTAQPANLANLVS